MDVKAKGLNVSGGASDVKTGKLRISGDISMAERTGGPPYEGPYVVTPKAYNEVILETNGKTMEDDVTVHKVPFFETSNVSGTTVYIAMEG